VLCMLALRDLDLAASADTAAAADGVEVDAEAVRRAIELSATKYCSVGATLASGITEIHHSYLVRDGAGPDRTAEVVVLGPGADPLATAEAELAGARGR